MATLKFFLKDPEKKSETLIHLIFQYGYFEIDPVSGRKKYKFLKMSSGEKIDPRHWNPDKGMARETRAFPQHAEFNARLRHLENTVFDVYRRMINDGHFPTPSTLKKEIAAELTRTKYEVTGNPDSIGFFDFIRQLIKESREGARLTPSGKHFSHYTIKGYVTTLNYLMEYQRSRKQRIDFDAINMEFYNKWVSWFYRQGKAKNTLGKHIKNLKVFMSEALERGLTKNTAFLNKKFKVLEEETDTIYLNDDELDRMLELDLSNKPGLERARDNFLLDCYIGLRIADFRNLRKDHIVEVEGVRMIRINMQKTEKPVAIPINKKALQILEKYDFQPRWFSDQDMNRKIKEVGRLAGINSDVTRVLTRGGKREENVHKKYELITNHTARRSFATNLYKAGVDTLVIMKMTGHRTERSFLKYIRVSEEENALRLARHDYFK